jgi:S1-C subfamily serine protease
LDVRRGWIRIAGQNVPYEFKLPDTAVLVNKVYAASIAARAGLMAGDIIVLFGDQGTTVIDDLHRLLTAEAANKSST